MQTFTIVSFLATALLVAAVPHGGSGSWGSGGSGGSGGGSGNSGNQCGNGLDFHCCNGVDSSSVEILAGQCSPLLAGSTCSGNQVFCCQTDQTGLINVAGSCSPLSV